MTSRLPSTVAVAVAVALTACGGSYVVKDKPLVPYDVAIVPGCPNGSDGALSRCQMGRALWAAVLWQRGDVKTFITSGAAVHSPYVEAEGIAEAMVALGVPAERVYLEPNAFHTDENIYLSLRIARRLGLHRIAIASSRGQATSACLFATGWGEPACAAFVFDEPAMRALADAHPGALERVRSRRIEPWLTLDEREQQITERTHRRRPASWVLYPYLAFLRATGNPMWIPPHVPAIDPVITWRAHLEAALKPGPHP